MRAHTGRSIWFQTRSPYQACRHQNRGQQEHPAALFGDMDRETQARAAQFPAEVKQRGNRGQGNVLVIFVQIGSFGRKKSRSYVYEHALLGSFYSWSGGRYG